MPNIKLTKKEEKESVEEEVKPLSPNIEKESEKEETVDNLKVLQREFVNIVEQVDLSSRRLIKIVERLQEIPEHSKDGGYNYALQDLSVLISIYSGTLCEVVTFIVEIAGMIESSFTTANNLANKINTMKQTIDTYIAKRLKS